MQKSTTTVLFALPFAGGSATSFYSWKKYTTPDVDLRPVELAGRGRRINEPLYTDADEAVDDILTQIKLPLEQADTYAIYGHSMGAMLTTKLVKRLHREGYPLPIHVFVSGRKSPQTTTVRPAYHQLPTPQFIERVLELGGTKKEFFDEPELVDLLLPMLRNDFRLAEQNQHDADVLAFAMPITVMVGKEEPFTAEDIHGWHQWTSSLCQLIYFNGGHFFINPYQQKIVQLMCDTLAAARQSMHHEPIK